MEGEDGVDNGFGDLVSTTEGMVEPYRGAETLRCCGEPGGAGTAIEGVHLSAHETAPP